jgi:hypothetical protein
MHLRHTPSQTQEQNYDSRNENDYVIVIIHIYQIPSFDNIIDTYKGFLSYYVLFKSMFAKRSSRVVLPVL